MTTKFFAVEETITNEERRKVKKECCEFELESEMTVNS